MVEALQLVLGGRANPGMVRAGAAEALVEARFVLGDGDEAREVILARSVPAEGRSRAWVDGRMAPLGALGEAAAELVEIHGQHEHRALVTPAAQRNVLDAFAGTDLSRVRAIRSQLQAIDEALAALGGDAQQRAREADVLRYQVEEIANAHLEDPDEEAALRLEEDRLADASAYRDAALEALELVDPAGEGGAVDLLGRAGTALAGREAFESPHARLAAAAVELSDLARTLRDEVEGWEDDPQRLIDVQERRRLLGELRRKYGEDLGAVMTYGREGAVRLAALENAEGEAARLDAERDRRLSELADAEAAVRKVRAKAAGSFGALVGERLGALAMSGARLEVRVAPEGTGEPIELALGANVGEAVQPLAVPPPAGSWPAPCWPSAWSGSAAPRRWSSTRSTPAWAAPPRWPWATRCTRWAATARCWSSPTWPRWRRRPTRRSAS